MTLYPLSLRKVAGLAASFFGCLAFNSVNAAQPVQIDGSTLLYWKFDDADTFGDASGKGRGGIPKHEGEDGVQGGSAGVLGEAAYFSGTSTDSTRWNTVYYKGLTPDDFSTREFTFQAWIKNPTPDSTADPTWGNLIASQRMGSNNLAWTLGIIAGETEGTVQFIMALPNSSSPYRIVSDSLTLDADKWYMVALVSKSISETKNDFSLYLAENNATNLTKIAEAESYNWSATWTTGPGTYASFAIGGEGLLSATNNGDIQGRRFHGYIDEVSYSNAARSEEYLIAAVIPEPSGLAFSAGSFAILGGILWRKARNSSHAVKR